jgi:hypothetical protein
VTRKLLCAFGAFLSNMTMMQYILVQLKLLKPETNGLINGKQSLREWWQNLLTDCQV